jgi:hypothetical protein
MCLEAGLLLDGLGRFASGANMGHKAEFPDNVTDHVIAPIIGYLKSDNHKDSCHLKGKTWDKLHAVLCAAGYNIQWLLRMNTKKGVTFLNKLYLRLQKLRRLTSLNLMNSLKPDLNRVAWA